MLEGYFFAVAAAAAVQYARKRDPLLLPVVALSAALMAAETRAPWDPWQDGLRLVAGGAALVLVAMLSRRRAAS